MMNPANNVTVIPPKKVKGVKEAPDEAPKLRVAAYCRVSTDRDEQEMSYEAQCEYYQNMIKSNPNWIFAGIYADEGITGMNIRKREGFKKLIADCEKEQIDKVFCKSISRFARNTIDCLKYVRILQAHRISIVFEKEQIDTMDQKGELFLTIMASMAQAESESISKNVELGFDYKYQKGWIMVNHNQFLGYTREVKNGPLVIVPEQAEVVRRIFKEYLEGKSWRQICKGLMADGVKTGAGNDKWWDSNIHQILTNEKYMGDALLRKTYTLDPLEKTRARNHGEVPQYYVSDCVPPIVSRDTFMQVQEMLAQRSSKRGTDGKVKGYSSRYALSGKIFCAECGDNYRRLKWMNHGSSYNVWRCKTRLSNSNACHSRTIHADDMERFITTAINELFGGKSNLIPMLTETYNEVMAEDGNAEMAAVEEKLQAIQLELISAGEEVHQYLGEQIDELRAEKNRIYAKNAERVETRINIKKMMDYLEESSEIKEYSEQLTRELVSRVIVYEDKVAIEFKAGLQVEIDE